MGITIGVIGSVALLWIMAPIFEWIAYQDALIEYNRRLRTSIPYTPCTAWMAAIPGVKHWDGRRPQRKDYRGGRWLFRIPATMVAVYYIFGMFR